MTTTKTVNIIQLGFFQVIDHEYYHNSCNKASQPTLFSTTLFNNIHELNFFTQFDRHSHATLQCTKILGRLRNYHQTINKYRSNRDNIWLPIPSHIYWEIDHG